MDRQIEAACLLRGNPSGLIPDLAEAAIAASVDEVFAEATSPVYPGLNLEHVVQGPPGVGVTAATWSGAWGRERRAADVTNFVLHTVEGPYSAGLSVARNGDNGAGFDLLTDPVRRVISVCNDWRRYVSHQAGYWPMNRESIGIEQAGSASQTGSWSDDYYRWFGASVIALLLKMFPNVPLRECTSWNQSGLIRHSTIYETAPGVNFRADPGRGYKMGLVLDAAKKAGGPIVVQPPPPKTGPEYVYLGAWAKDDVATAEAARKALAAGGYQKAVMATTAGDLNTQSEKVVGMPAGKRHFLVIGSPTTAKLSIKARATKQYPADPASNLWDCVGPSLAGTREEVSWRLAAICKKAKLNADRVLKAYEDELSKTAPAKPAPAPPEKVYTAADFAVLDGYRMWPAVARDCARIANEFGLAPAAFSTYANDQGKHGDAPPGGSVDILVSDRYGTWVNERQLAFGKGVVRWLYGEYDSGRMPLDYIIFAKVYNHLDGRGDQPYNPEWSLGKNRVSDDHGDHIHVTWEA